MNDFTMDEKSNVQILHILPPQTNRPISESQDADLRGSLAALERAAQRARKIATQTGTAIVVSRHGVIKHMYPPFAPATVTTGNAPAVQEP